MLRDYHKHMIIKVSKLNIFNTLDQPIGYSSCDMDGMRNTIERNIPKKFIIDRRKDTSLLLLLSEVDNVKAN